MSASRSGTLERTERILKVFRYAAIVISAAALFGLVLMITADTFFRFVLLQPFPATVEISQLVEPYVIFLPMAFALAAGSHVRVTMLTSRLGPKAEFFSDCLAYAVGFFFFAVMTYISWFSFWQSFVINETVLAAIKLYWWTGRFAMPLGMAAVTIECAYQFIRTLNARGAAAGA